MSNRPRPPHFEPQQWCVTHGSYRKNRTRCAEAWGDPFSKGKCQWESEIGIDSEALLSRGRDRDNPMSHREEQVLHMLEADPYRSDWDTLHDLIADWHADQNGHKVCGCSLHQALCWCTEDTPYDENDGSVSYPSISEDTP